MIAQFYGWMDMPDEKEPKPNILIRRIDVIRFDVLRFTCTRAGLPLSRSWDKMEQGYYPVYSGGCTYFAQ